MERNNLLKKDVEPSRFYKKEGYKADFCKILSKIDPIEFLVSKAKPRNVAPYSVSLTSLIGYPNEFRRTIDMLLDFIKAEVGVGFSRIAGATTNALLYAPVLAHILKRPMLSVKTDETKGRERQIYGILYPGDNVLVIDDMISTGKAAIEATEKLRSEGALIGDFVVLLDNERGGEEKLKRKDIRLHALIKIHEVADCLENVSVITRNQRNIIYDWIKKERI